MSRLDKQGGTRDAIAGRLSGRIYLDLKERLIDGEFEPGSRMSMDALRSDYDASKQPLMEAFRLLAADGIVEIVPQVGCRPVVYSPAEIFDFYLVFAASEGAVASAAAARRSPAQLDELRVVLEQTAGLEALADAREAQHRYRLANREFHGLIQRMAGSRMISLLSLRMWDLSDYLINTVEADVEAEAAAGAEPSVEGGEAGEIATGGRPRLLGERHRDHGLIVDALAAGDSDAARAAMSEHILRSIEAFAILPGNDSVDALPGI